MVLKVPSAALESDSMERVRKAVCPSCCNRDLLLQWRSLRDSRDSIMAWVSYLPHIGGKQNHPFCQFLVLMECFSSSCDNLWARRKDTLPKCQSTRVLPFWGLLVPGLKATILANMVGWSATKLLLFYEIPQCSEFSWSLVWGLLGRREGGLHVRKVTAVQFPEATWVLSCSPSSFKKGTSWFQRHGIWIPHGPWNGSAQRRGTCSWNGMHTMEKCIMGNDSILSCGPSWGRLEAPDPHHLVSVYGWAMGWNRSLNQTEINLRFWLLGFPDAANCNLPRRPA